MRESFWKLNWEFLLTLTLVPAAFTNTAKLVRCCDEQFTTVLPLLWWVVRPSIDQPPMTLENWFKKLKSECTLFHAKVCVYMHSMHNRSMRQLNNIYYISTYSCRLSGGKLENACILNSLCSISRVAPKHTVW